ncbi:MAG TPA: patatin-like phospholipase family protein [Acidimicrobiales bacterium]|nr:patatin-like phospholipase family protein [Acidimicrobiales bacterium]
MTGRTALVLAGGGAKGAFEAGAVKYLVEEEGLLPEVITATSVGAICAAVLAQARTHDELCRRVQELHDDLLAMTHRDLVFARQPWLEALAGSALGDAVERLVTEDTRPPLPGEPASAPPVQRRSRLRTAARVARSLPSVVRAKRAYSHRTGSVLSLEPLAHTLRHGGDLAPVDPGLIARPGLELRMAVTALGDGVLRFVTESGTLVEADAVTPVPHAGPVDVIEGALASASVPLVFAPRPLAGDVYVDGGVVDNVPVGAAARLGATRIFAVLAIPLTQPPDTRDYTEVSPAGVFLRSVGGIAFAGRQLANLSTTVPPGTEVTVIDPVIDVVGPFEVAQGLMLLDMDYGWMRAADVVADVDDATRSRAAAATDAVTVGRTRAWHLEEAMWRSGRAERRDLVELNRLKDTVRDAVAERKGLGLPTPPDAEQWWMGHEVHQGPAPAGLALGT